MSTNLAWQCSPGEGARRWNAYRQPSKKAQRRHELWAARLPVIGGVAYCLLKSAYCGDKSVQRWTVSFLLDCATMCLGSSEVRGAFERRFGMNREVWVY